MTLRLADDGITLVQGLTALHLRPCLRAALLLERLHNGFPGLIRKLAALDTATVRAVILATATDPAAARAFLADHADTPLGTFADLVQRPLTDLCMRLVPAADDDATPPDPDAEPMPWPEAYARLYGYATGWLGWTPADAWAATPTEIAVAFDAHVQMLRAIHGAADEATATSGPTAEQRAANIAEGLDPEFDRAGLRALKARLASEA